MKPGRRNLLKKLSGENLLLLSVFGTHDLIDEIDQELDQRATRSSNESALLDFGSVHNELERMLICAQ